MVRHLKPDTCYASSGSQPHGYGPQSGENSSPARIVWTGTPGVYLAVWVSGPEGAQEISYRFFER